MKDIKKEYTMDNCLKDLSDLMKISRQEQKTEELKSILLTEKDIDNLLNLGGI